MQRALLGVLAMLFTMSQAVTFSQSAGQSSVPPKAAIDITDEEVTAVLAHQPPSTDRQFRVVDFGSYQLAIGVIYRGPTAAPAAAPSRGRGAAPGAPPPVPCGQASGVSSGVSGITHDSTVETYIIKSGSGVLVTGGHIISGRQFAPDDQVTRILNGPSCTGMIAAGPDVVTRTEAGDIVIIPENVAHGWTGITDHVTYLSVRPDPKKVLQTGYVHPAIAAMKKSSSR